MPTSPVVFTSSTLTRFPAACSPTDGCTFRRTRRSQISSRDNYHQDQIHQQKQMQTVADPTRSWLVTYLHRGNALRHHYRCRANRQHRLPTRSAPALIQSADTPGHGNLNSFNSSTPAYYPSRSFLDFSLRTLIAIQHDADVHLPYLIVPVVVDELEFKRALPAAARVKVTRLSSRWNR